MKKFIGFIVLVMTTCFQLRSQHTEGNPFARLGYKADVYTFGEKSEFHDREEVVEIGDVLFNTRTNEVVGFVKKDVDSLIELKPELQSMSIDPHCEKYYSITPYAYCFNNPVRFIDPNGMDIYRYDDKTGKFILAKPTDDKFDQVGKFKYDKKTREYILQTNKNGDPKTRIDNIEKGILKDGINFMEKDNVIAVGGDGQASVDGVDAFVLNLSEMVGKEISGAYFSKDGAAETTHVSIGNYKNNTLTDSGYAGQILWAKMNPSSKIEESLTGFFHTHPSIGYNKLDRTTSSLKDKQSRNNALGLMPLLRFYILTQPIKYGDKFPYKINYTNEW